jgi:hypothetical protein
METFHLLSRGGIKFDKMRFSSDVQLFNSGSADSPTTRATSSKKFEALSGDKLPSELDFFKYAAGGTSSMSPSKGKAKAVASEDQLEVPATKKRKRHDPGVWLALLMAIGVDSTYVLRPQNNRLGLQRRSGSDIVLPQPAKMSLRPSMNSWSWQKDTAHPRSC